MHPRTFLPLAIALAVCACSPREQAGQTEAGGDIGTDVAESGAATDFPERFRAFGTEPFWAIHILEDRLRYMTPEDPEGQEIEFAREQTERSNIAIHGQLQEKPLTLTGTIRDCYDSMSDTTYPLSIELTIGTDTLTGCARPAE